MGWGQMLGYGGMALATGLGSYFSSESADDAQDEAADIRRRLLDMGAGAASDLRTGYADLDAELGDFGKLDVGNFNELVQRYYTRNLDSANRAVDFVTSKTRANSLRRGLGESTYDIESKRVLADKKNQLYKDADTGAHDDAVASFGKLMSLRKGAYDAVGRKVNDPYQLSIGSDRLALTSADNTFDDASRRANINSGAFGGALTKFLDKSGSYPAMPWTAGNPNNRVSPERP